MRMCQSCYPCCDFCIHAYHEWFEIDGEYERGSPIGCIIHYDEKHQRMAESCGCCEDYYCFIQYEKDVLGEHKEDDE